MSAGWAALGQVVALLVGLGLSYRPVGDWLFRALTDERDWAVEAVGYRLTGVDPRAEQRWAVYARSVLAFSAASVLAIYALLRLQAMLPGSLGHQGVAPIGAWNIAVSFVTNTNWQWYSPEAVVGYLVQAAGLAVANFTSAAVGIAVAAVLVRGFVREGVDRLGNFWVDLVRITVRVLLPGAALAAVVLLLSGVIQNLAAPHEVATIAGGVQTIPGGLVASQEAIKELGTNGGGFFNANSAHPFENPTAWTNLFELYLLLVIPFSLPRTLGRMVGSPRQGLAILGAMAVLWTGSVVAITASESAGRGLIPQLAGAAMEGKEARFGVAASALFAASTTGTSTGAVNSMHDSFTAAGGGFALANMLLGEVSPGGTGTGLYGILVVAVLTVFLAGLMVGRTPELLGKKISRREVTMVALYVLVTPVLVLLGAGITAGDSGLWSASIQDPGAHGLTEILYAYASAGNNNGSAFAGFNAGTDYQNLALGTAMLLGRFIPMILVMGLAGALAAQRRVPVSEGTLPTDSGLFVVLLVGVVVIVALLTYVPALALAPIAEALA